MAKSKQPTKHKSLFVPCATVFVSSFVLLVLELVAGRLIARHLGSSLYTWTAVIGVVLAGLTTGNYLGGRIADRFGSSKTLAVLFLLASLSCVGTVVANNLLGRAGFLMFLSWPTRIFIHVTFTFFLPSVMLGMISPVVAKLALDKGLATGRTIGAVYAWGAAGSIAGTFATGYFLIAAMGTVTLIWSVAGVLLVMALLYGVRLLPVRLGAGCFVLVVVMVSGPWPWVEKAACALALREPHDPTILYEDETQYCYVHVHQVPGEPAMRQFIQDTLIHSKINMDDITDLRYNYSRVYATITHARAAEKDRLSVLTIGGGGYVFPRYIEHFWPGSRNEVAEIDPGVTKAAEQAFGVDPQGSINTISLDGRNYVDQLIEEEKKTGVGVRYDFIYGDAVNNFSTPFQIVTKEFNDNVYQLLERDGVYMLNLIDTLKHGHFLAAVVTTLEHTFEHVYVMCVRGPPPSFRNTFIVVAAKEAIDIREAFATHGSGVVVDLFGPAARRRLADIAGGTILTDDYAPVEHLLAPVVRDCGFEQIIGEFLGRATAFTDRGLYEETLREYDNILYIRPNATYRVYTSMAETYLLQGRIELAIDSFGKAIGPDHQRGLMCDVSYAQYQLGRLLKQCGRGKEARTHFEDAAEFLQRRLRDGIEVAADHLSLAQVLVELGRPPDAIKHLGRVLELYPLDNGSSIMLAELYIGQGQADNAREILQQAIDAAEAQQENRPDELANLRAHLNAIPPRQ